MCKSNSSRRFRCKGKDFDGKDCKYALIYHEEDDGRCHFGDHRSLFNSMHTCCSMQKPIQDSVILLDHVEACTVSFSTDSSETSLSPIFPSQSTDVQDIVDNCNDDSIMLQFHAHLRQRSSNQVSPFPAEVSFLHDQQDMDNDSDDRSIDRNESPYSVIVTDLKSYY